MSAAIETRCCVVGGGPAGMMAGFLLARAGIDVVVLEKHGDFFRDFRGDTIHPSTLELFHELGLLDELLELPHYKARELKARVGTEEVAVADFSHLPTQCKFIAFMPQWDFLNFLAERAKRLTTFRLVMDAEAADLIEADGVVTGVRARTPNGWIEARAALTIGADGRHSTVRERAGLSVVDLGAPMDVLWFRLGRRGDDPAETFGVFAPGRTMILINRGDYWQCGFVIRKAGIGAVKSEGLPAFRDEIARSAPFLADRTAELSDWDKTRLLTVKVDRLREWSRPGLLCIGDAAHAMSPIGGVGVNLAIQDAVAAANLLAAPLKRGAPTPDELGAVQRRREPPARAIQAAQIFIQNRIVAGVLAGASTARLPLPLRLLRRFPILRRLPARVIGLGLRPERIEGAAAAEGN